MSTTLLELELWIQGINDQKKVVYEAVKIAKDYPMLTIREVIEKAKEVIECESSK